MSFKKFIKERNEKLDLINEIKNMLLEKSDKKLSRYDLSNFNEILDIFINIGYSSYFSGNMDVFNYYVNALFELLNLNSEENMNVDYIKQIEYLGHMSIYNHNIIAYSIIISNIKNKIYEQNELNLINDYLNIIKNLALICENNDFEIGLLTTINELKFINEYFNENDLQMNSVFLKNIIIYLMHWLEINEKDDLKNKIIKEIKEVIDIGISIKK